jgi:hypothetical protein
MRSSTWFVKITLIATIVSVHCTVLAQTQQAPEVDPLAKSERAFWLHPGWSALEDYAQHLKAHQGLAEPWKGPWPRDEALERMKAHLASGIKGPVPTPYADWSALKRKTSQVLDLSEATPQAQVQLELMMNELFYLGLYENIERKALPAHLIPALEFSSISPSLFRSEAQLAPPGATTEEVGGRFNIIVRNVVTPRPPYKPDDRSAGLYDMQAHTTTLVRPVKRVQLYRNGQLQVQPSHVRENKKLWIDSDGPMCEGWLKGFSFGDGDSRIYRYFDADNAARIQLTGKAAQVRHNPIGSLYAFYTTVDMPANPAARVETTVRMDRQKTGFVRGTYLYYDLDRDGIADLVVWEGQGKGPGHIDGPTKTDDRWYRLVLVNINGAWKFLGHDAFSYGCGC